MPDDIDFVQVAIMKHVTLTGSRYAERAAGRLGERCSGGIVKVMPREYKRALAEQAKREREARAAPSRRSVAVTAVVNVQHVTVGGQDGTDHAVDECSASIVSVVRVEHG